MGVIAPAETGLKSNWNISMAGSIIVKTARITNTNSSAHKYRHFGRKISLAALTTLFPGRLGRQRRVVTTIKLNEQDTAGLLRSVGPRMISAPLYNYAAGPEQHL